ncbi:Utp14-domain-containing protein [Punctularia strigosozonata HHB-11173 SS5]|uniref:Utp14-domain-containing protein n=1 Tax=Punctularia strigosozonata (strain HHB-11173) TaxID=741275 RepID=UPI00044168BA|nr:Utp14-domain-containing protein [Punctularia strigosozonata HHB-11173 SS5]EIN14320.1 Utp14-domain-containing protein [Punctularia strigosozonata HHB-11173 SS5]
MARLEQKYSRSSTSKANAAGFSKRRSGKQNALKIHDVYDHDQAKLPRSRSQVDTRLDRDEMDPALSISGAEDEQEALRARLIGENEENEGLGSDEDEEIDSDAAFEESDEERFAGFFTSKQQKRKQKAIPPTTLGRTVRFVDVDLNEGEDDSRTAHQHGHDQEGHHDAEDEEDEEDEDGGDGFIDVLDVLDGRAKPYLASDGEGDDLEDQETAGATSRKGMEDGQSAKQIHDADEEESEEEQEPERHRETSARRDIDTSDAESETALAGLNQFILGLDPGPATAASKRGISDDFSEADRPRKRRVIAERSEVGPENEFGGRISSKLHLDDLLAPLASKTSTLQSLKKSAKTLSSKGGALAAPLPQRTQEKLDREAAYEQTREEAEHLSFPLQAAPHGKTSNLELNAKFKPTTELESSVDRLLKAAQLREEDLEKTEELKMNHLTIEEVAARRLELRRTRELMFRAEVKAKRIAKIKSKTYRRLKKKERERLAAKLDDGGEDDESARIEHELNRARERATLKHKNTGKWAKSLKTREHLEEDQRRDINEMLDRGERLKRRIQGVGSEGEGEESDSEEERDVDEVKAGAFEELRGLMSEADTEDEAGGIFKMKFMAEAAARQAHENRQVADEFLLEMGAPVGSDEERVDCEEDQGVSITRTGGRVTFKPSTSLSSRPIGSLHSDTSSVTLRSTDFPPEPTTAESEKGPPSPLSRQNATNPWLASQSNEESIRAPRKANEVVSKQSSAADKSKNKLRKIKDKTANDRETAKADAELEISTTEFLTLKAPTTKSKLPAQRRVKHTPKTDVLEEGSDHDSEIEEQEQNLRMKARAGQTAAFQQRDLVARAFSGDNVVQDFAETKRREIQADAPKEVDTTLPGWGSWGGRGTKKQAPKQHLIKQIAGVDPKSRADFDKSHVIISEKRDKKAAKYLVKDLPYPYTSKAQFERSTETPLGLEWNTRVGFQRGTLPRISKKMGQVIAPLEKLQ